MNVSLILLFLVIIFTMCMFLQFCILLYFVTFLMFLYNNKNVELVLNHWCVFSLVIFVCLQIQWFLCNKLFYLTNPSEFLTERSLACHRIIFGTDLGYYIIVQHVSKQEAPSCKKGVFWVFFFTCALFIVDQFSIFFSKFLKNIPLRKTGKHYYITTCITFIDIEGE